MSIKIVVILTAIIYSYALVDKARRSMRLHVQGLSALKAVIGDSDVSNPSEKVSNIIPFSRTGPGYVSDVPSSYTNQGQRELARIIVGIAILYMSFRVKIQSLYPNRSYLF